MTALWLPCTQMQTLEKNPPLHIVRGEGSLLFDKNGKSYLDMISSWWVNLHGHCNPYINAKIKEQLDTLEHTLLASITHPKIEQLAERLIDLLPNPFQKIFFADSGSGAVEVALKMSLQYWQQQSKLNKKRFICLEQGYHGETIGSLSVTDIPLFSKQYEPMIVQQIKMPSPANLTARHNKTSQVHEQDCLDKLETILENQADNICAIILEPLVQGASGMIMYSANFLLGVAKLAKKYQIHVIYDEIAVGFGRTGTMFAVEQLLNLVNHDVQDIYCPDFICLSKGLTAGYLPMSCVATTDDIYQAFYDEKVEKGFLHSHSFTGNPLASTAGLASLDIFEQNQVLQHNQILIQALATGLEWLAETTEIANIRQTGMIVAFSLINIQGKQLANLCLEKGLLIRPIGNEVYLIPPYCTTVEQIQHTFEILQQNIQMLSKNKTINIAETIHLA